MKRMSTTLASAVTLLALAGTANTWASDFYRQRNLVSDSNAVRAENRDMNLVNAWGLAFNPFAVAWVADNGTGVATLYNGEGQPQSLVVTIPGAGGAKGNPTGTVFYGGMAFDVHMGNKSGPSRFLFVSEDGGIAGWAPTVDMTHAIRVIDNSKNKAIYKGVAISGNGRTALLYAADFHNGKIDVYDSSFKPVTMPNRPFSDPNLPAGYGPFGIQAINGDIYVSYARQDEEREDDVKGPGLGIVNVFDPNGRFLRRLASGGALNAPWGMTLAPASFGRFSNRLLIGNFGDGTINAYDLATGKWVGNLQGEDRKPIRIDGLWGLSFGNGVSGQPIDTLFFTAGPQDEKHGLYGRLDVIDDDGQGGGGGMGSQY
ncbi:MAG: TIGR03118 family protein [Massilia sp.]